MNPELETKLVTAYPSLFRGKDAPVTENLMSFGCECGDGWFELINQACQLIAQHAEPGFLWTQIKEKYGTLRLNYTGGDGYTDGVVDMAEALSAITCEACGAPGKLRGTGWLQTLCDKCAKEAP